MSFNQKGCDKYYLPSLILCFISLPFYPENIFEEKTGNANETIFENSQSCIPIDLGLSSGTLWGDRNVGSQSISDFGELYAWGETTTKTDYSQGGYDPKDKPTSRINSAENDVAKVLLGEEWSIPTEEHFKELLTECQWIWKQIGGHNGFEIIGKMVISLKSATNCFGY